MARTPRKDRCAKDHRALNHISKMVPPTIHVGPPEKTRTNSEANLFFLSSRTVDEEGYRAFGTGQACLNLGSVQGPPLTSTAEFRCDYFFAMQTPLYTQTTAGDSASFPTRTLQIDRPGVAKFIVSIENGEGCSAGGRRPASRRSP